MVDLNAGATSEILTVLPLAILAAFLVLIVAHRTGRGFATAAPAPPLVVDLAGIGGAAGDCDVVVVDGGPQKIAAIKEVRLISGLRLGAAKSFVETPGSRFSNVTPEVAAQIKARLEAAGMNVEIRYSASTTPP